jgi:PsbP-like protein
MRSLVTLSLMIGVALPACAEEIALKDGTKIVGHLTEVKSDKIEVETAYGKMQVKRSDILTISFPENGATTTASAPAPAGTKDPPTAASAAGTPATPAIEQSLVGTQYFNKTGRFSLTLPPEWKINANLSKSPATIAGLSSRDDLRFVLVSREEYSGSLESYKGLGELQIRKSLANYEELSESAITIDGKAGVLISYRGTLPKADNLPVQFLVAIVPSGTTYTRIAAWCVEPLFHEMQPTFERILNSYHSSMPTAQTAHLTKP